MTDCLQPAWFLQLLARASASGLSSVHIAKCSAFASKGILESLPSCINLHFEEGDFKVVVVMSVFVIKLDCILRKLPHLYVQLLCISTTMLCSSELACDFVSLSLRFFSSPFFLMAVIPDFSVPESWEESSSVALYCLSALSNPEF